MAERAVGRCLPIWLFILLCFAQGASAQGLRHQYDLSIDADLRSVSVRAQLAKSGLVLRARHADRGDMRSLQHCEGVGLPAAQGAKLQLPTAVHCVTYSARLRPNQRRRNPVVSGISVTSPSTWLWLPELGSEDTVELTVSLPEGVVLSAPWRRLPDGDFSIHASPQSDDSVIYIGPFAQFSVRHLVQPVAYVGSSRGEATVQRWLRQNVQGLVQTFGGFPNPDAQVVVVEVGAQGDSPVSFGHVSRDQGETVRFFVDTSRDLDDFLNDWTAPQEFARLALPNVAQAWVTEGFARYFQNVLQARAGRFSELEAWQHLTRSFRQAAEGGRVVTPNQTTTMPLWNSRMMVYWSGVALALHADVELRHASRGAQSLSTVLRDFARCCLPSRRTWQARELFAKMDELAGRQVLVNLYDQYADQAGTPDTARLFRLLGVIGMGEEARLDDEADFAPLRQAMMRSE